MINGCRKTLDFFNIKNYNLYHCDIGCIDKKIKQVDSVATDLPYGKATTTKGENIEILCKRAFENVSKILKDGGRAVFGLSNDNAITLGEEFFTLVEIHKIRAHKSLTRYFVVFKK
jgi:tRNA G10  N-methylase Trm11